MRTLCLEAGAYAGVRAALRVKVGRSAGGEEIRKTRCTCHNVVADEDSDSALLTVLGIQQPPPAPAEPAEPVADSASR